MFELCPFSIRFIFICTIVVLVVAVIYCACSWSCINLEFLEFDLTVKYQKKKKIFCSILSKIEHGPCVHFWLVSKPDWIYRKSRKTGETRFINTLKCFVYSLLHYSVIITSVIPLVVCFKVSISKRENCISMDKNI